MAPLRGKDPSTSSSNTEAQIEQPISCDVCHQTFSKRDHLVRHQRSHTGEKPYACNFCGKAYARSDVLRRHIVTNHKEADDNTPLPPLRKNNKSTAVASGSTKAASRSPPEFQTNGSNGFHDMASSHTSSSTSSKHDEAAVAELLQSFHQNGSPALTVSPVVASPPDTLWYDQNGGRAQHQQQQQQQQQQSQPLFTHQQLNGSMLPGLNGSLNYNGQHQVNDIPLASSSTSSPYTSDLNPHSNGMHSNLGSANGLSSDMWDPMLTNLISNAQPGYPSYNPFEGITTPLSTDQFWESTPFDFSGLFQQEPWNLPSDYKRAYSPPISESTPAENLANIWPTRPSRRKTGCCVVGMDYPDMGTTEANGHVIWNRRIDDAAAQRMYAHLQTGNIAYRLPMPTKEVLAQMIELYFIHWHPNWPMLHYPTFNPSRVSALVMLNMVALGALFTRTKEGEELASALMEKMHEALSFCMSAQVSLYFDIHDRDVQALCQAYMMRQLYWLAAGDRNMLEATQLLHSAVANVARRAGMFTSDVCEPQSDNESLDLQWRRWVVTEMRRRTALCFCLNDLSFANLFMTPPYATVGSVSWSLPENDALFSAPNAQEWDRLRKQIPFHSLPLHDLAASLFTSHPDAMFEGHRQSPFSTHILMSSIFSIVLATRVNRPELDKELSRDCKSQAPLASALAAALRALQQMRGHNQYGTFIIWHLAWTHLLVDLKLMEVLCGREGPDATASATERGREWSTTPRARRAVLHCLAILQHGQSYGVGNEPPPHVYVALFQSWMVVRVFLRFQPQLSAGAPSAPQWAAMGAYGLGVLDGNRANVSDCTRWINLGLGSQSGIYLPQVVQEYQTTLRAIGFTKLRVLLADLMVNVEEAQSNMDSYVLLP